MLRAALIAADLPYRHYELTQALEVALTEPDAEARWLAGEPIFAAVPPSDVLEVNAAEPVDSIAGLNVAEDVVTTTSLGDGWHIGPMPAKTYWFGGVVLKGDRPESGFYFADFHGDYVLISDGGTRRSNKVFPDQIAYWNNSIRVPIVVKTTIESKSAAAGYYANTNFRLTSVDPELLKRLQTSAPPAACAANGDGCAACGNGGGNSGGYGGPIRNALGLLGKLLPRNRGGCGLFGRRCGG